jgi:hypothetical protein
MREKKRYVVTMDMYVYADNDYMARKKSHELKDGISASAKIIDQIKILEIGEQPFATTDFRKLDDISEPTKKSTLRGSFWV